MANIIYCTCFCQHAGKQDRIHARTNMVKTALGKLFAGILCGCVVLLVLLIGGEANAERNHPIISNHILAALFNNQDSEKKTPCTVPFKLSEIFLSISLTLSLSHSFSLSLYLSIAISREVSDDKTIETIF